MMSPQPLRLSCHTRYSAIEDWMEVLERFVVLLYDRTSSQESVNQARTQLFTQKGRAIAMDFPHTSSTNTAHKEDCLQMLGTDDGCSF